MATFRKGVEFRAYVEPPLSGEDVLAIKDSINDVETSLLEILEYATSNGLDFRLQYKEDDDRYHAVVYCNQSRHEWKGVGVRAKAKSPIDAVNALALRLRKIGKTDLLTLITGTGDSGDIA